MKLDYLLQYQVERISTHDKQPALVFENGIKVISDTKWDDELKGARLKSVEDNDDSERLTFGIGQGADEKQIQFDLVKGGYRILDPTTNTLIDPNEPVDPNADLPPEPVERISTGPSDEEVRRELDRGEREEEEAQ